MAKDPAVLWYWGDWYSGTSLMSRFLKGCYMDLLHAQFNNGRLSLEEIKISLGSDFGQAWPTLQKKFTRDNNGMYFSERLEREKIKREKFCKSRSNNKSGRKKSYDKSHDKDMINHMENENENRNINEEEEENIIKPPEKILGSDTIMSIDSLMEDCLNDKIYFVEYISRNFNVNPQQLSILMKSFNDMLKSTGESIKSKKDYRRHFQNWLRKQPLSTKPKMKQI